MTMVFGIYDDDYYNRNNRNTKNTSIYDYNCGGYALNTFNWYCPYDLSHKEQVCCSLFGEMGIEETLDYMIEFMLNDFANQLRVINSIQDLTKEEYAIAFRVGEWDFHYLKRGDNGVWYHKMGNQNICVFPKEKIFANSWCDGTYTSRVVLLAMKKKENQTFLHKTIDKLLNL